MMSKVTYSNHLVRERETERTEPTFLNTFCVCARAATHTHTSSSPHTSPMGCWQEEA